MLLKKGVKSSLCDRRLAVRTLCALAVRLLCASVELIRDLKQRHIYAQTLKTAYFRIGGKSNEKYSTKTL